jgi:membrane-associated phospholipid phosphatase
MSEIPLTAIGDRRPGPALLLAASCVLALALTWVFAEIVPATHVRDALALYDFTKLDRPFVEVPANALLDLLEPWFFAVWGLVLVWLAMSQGRRRLALAIALVLPAAPLSAELLKPLLAHPHAQVAPVYIANASWPSGHATAATVLVWCAVLVAPSSHRRLVAAPAAHPAAAVGCALLILAWHMPSDVLGGYLLATMWVALAVAALRTDRRKRKDRGSTSGPARARTSGLAGATTSGPAPPVSRETSLAEPPSASQASPSVGAPPCAPGLHNGSGRSVEPSFAARARMNNMSDKRFR